MAEQLWSLAGVSVPGRAAPRLDDVTLRIDAGITAVIGHSGAGKTTLCDVLVGFERGFSGRLDAPSRTPGPLPLYWAPADGLWADTDARGHLSRVAPDGRASDELIATFDLAWCADAKPAQLSAGERDRLAVARALASRAAVLVLDEPFAHVERAAAWRYWRALIDLARAQGQSLVYATHAPDAVIGHADRVVCLRLGRVLAAGPVDEIHQRPASATIAACLGEANWLEPAQARRWFGAEAPQCLRPERVVVQPDPAGGATVRASRFHGAIAESELTSDDGTQLRILHRPPGALAAGTRVAVRLALMLIALGLGGCGDAPPTSAPRASVSVMLPLDGDAQPAPRGVGHGIGGEVLVVDTAGRVLTYGADLVLRRQWRMPAWDVGRPEGVARLRDGRVAVADTHYHRVVIFAEDGTVAGMFGTQGDEAGRFRYPVAVACDDADRLYVAEYGGNDRIQVFTADGAHLRTIGSFGTAPGRFQRPQGLAWRDGRLAVADAMNNRIQVMSDQGELIRVIGEGLDLRFPYAVAFDREGRLWTVEYSGNRVTRLDDEGRILARHGGGGRGAGEYSTPWGMTVADDDAVWIADTGNRRLTRLVP
ncbi:MAG TPA: ATP-binding cassette domain-containing protein [Planctomycetota bacterium]|nr:ATP-binding cassette domain-containing protein [Planctomycetota bacterium]